MNVKFLIGIMVSGILVGCSTMPSSTSSADEIMNNVLVDNTKTMLIQMSITGPQYVYKSTGKENSTGLRWMKTLSGKDLYQIYSVTRETGIIYEKMVDNKNGMTFVAVKGRLKKCSYDCSEIDSLLLTCIRNTLRV